MHRTYALDASFSLEVLSPALPFPPAVEERVEVVWETEKSTRGDDLFNGPVLSLVTHDQANLTVRATDYRHFLAGLRVPDLAATLGVRPLAVTGIVLCSGGIVLGCRAAHLAQAAGRWEAAPAGGLDRPEPYAQLLRELREELGIAPHQITSRRPIALIEDVGTGVHDILFLLDTPLSVEAVTAAHASLATKEYATVAVVPAGDLPTFLTEHEAELLPALAPMLRAAGLLD